MKKSTLTNINHIKRILKEIKIINDAMNQFEIIDINEFEKSNLAQRVFTQCITTIEMTKRLLSDDVKNNIKKFNRIKLAKTRNIASHDYDNVDMDIVYEISIRLIDENILSELENEIKHLEELQKKEEEEKKQCNQ